jgi:hypothetical protein
MDTALKYEKLLRKLFKCGQDGDPLRYASSAVYARSILEIEKGKGYELRAGLFSALRKYQIDYVAGAFEDMEDFSINWEEAEYWTELCFKTKDQMDIIKIINVLENLIIEKERERETI